MARQIDYAGVVLAMDPEQEERKQVRTQLQWDYGQVPALHRKAVEDAAVEIAVNGRKMTASVMGVGDALIRAKGLLAHGQFEEWCRVEFGMSERTAQNMMNVARTFAGKSEKISLLSDSTLYLLAAPSTPEPVRDAVIAQAEAAGRSPSVAEVRKSIRLFVENLRGIVRLWAEEHWLRSGREIPPNPAHTNGTFWQELTAWLHGNVTDTWTEGDLKAAINQEYRYYRDDDRAAPAPPVKVERTTAPGKVSLVRWLEQTAPVAGQTLMQVLATDEERQIEAGIAAMDEAERQALAASDLQVMQPAPAAQLVPAPLTTQTLADFLRPVVDGWDAAQLRRDAQKLDGAVWRQCIAALRESPYRNGYHWTPGLLREALRMLAADIEPGTPAPELAASDLQVMQTAAPVAAERVVSEREAELQRWWVRLIGMQSDLHNWADLTGRHVATGECERGLRKMLEITERELAILRGEVVKGESEGWG